MDFTFGSCWIAVKFVVLYQKERKEANDLMVGLLMVGFG